MKLIYKKVISVVCGYFASLWSFFINVNWLFDSLLLCIFFIWFYWLFDRLFLYYESKHEKVIPNEQR